MAAARAGIKTILLPHQNKRDLEEVDDEVKKKVSFQFVEDVDQVLEQALGKRELQKAIRANGKAKTLKNITPSEGAGKVAPKFQN